MSRLKHDEGFGEPSVTNICDSDSWSRVMIIIIGRCHPGRGGGRRRGRAEPAADQATGNIKQAGVKIKDASGH
jgi:hypothetical protein